MNVHKPVEQRDSLIGGLSPTQSEGMSRSGLRAETGTVHTQTSSALELDLQSWTGAPAPGGGKMASDS